jgi:hypothetical protein
MSEDSGVGIVANDVGGNPMSRATIVRSLFRCSLAASVAVLVTSSAATAQLSESALKCREVVASKLRKLINVSLSVNAKCYRERDSGDPVQCNDAPGSPRYVSAVRKAEPAIMSACESDVSTLMTPEYYNSCPAVGCMSVNEPMQSAQDLAFCVSCMGVHLVRDLGVEVLGSPDSSMLSSDDVACRAAISGYGKFVKSALVFENKCQHEEDLEGSYDPAACADVDPKGKVEGSLTKAGAKLLEDCAAATISNLDSCASDTPANLKACVETRFSQLEDLTFLSGYVMPQP